LDAADSLQRRKRDLSLRFELGRIVDVLPRTATARSKYGADGIDALRTGLEERVDNATRVVGPPRGDSNANAVSRCREGNEDDPAIGRVADAVPARSELLDYEFDPLFGVRFRRRTSRLATIRTVFSTGDWLTPSTRSGRGPQRVGMYEPARGSRRPHQGQKRMNAHEVGQRQRGQRSGSAECDQTRLTLRLHSGQ
jgi:hypothetical protein